MKSLLLMIVKQPIILLYANCLQLGDFYFFLIIFNLADGNLAREDSFKSCQIAIRQIEDNLARQFGNLDGEHFS